MNDPSGGHKSNFEQSTRKSEKQIGDPGKTKKIKNFSIMFVQCTCVMLSNDQKRKNWMIIKGVV